jgi:hypothetical protein
MSLIDEFADAVVEHVFEDAVRTVQSLLSNPPGRTPSAELLGMSRWYQSLSETDRRSIEGVASMAADAAVFGLLAAIDGARPLLTGKHLRLEAVDSDGSSIEITGSEPLHDLYRARVDPLGRLHPGNGGFHR